ncbi:hypothetical protein [Pleomorphomonas sp. T1.2MG-36]|nr:hypothetical protein [Pleomorphomonas sp. T1.2MG-36]
MDLFAGLGCKLDDKYAMILGYRGLAVDYEHGDHKYPIAGLKIRF